MAKSDKNKAPVIRNIVRKNTGDVCRIITVPVTIENDHQSENHTYPMYTNNENTM